MKDKEVEISERAGNAMESIDDEYFAIIKEEIRKKTVHTRWGQKAVLTGFVVFFADMKLDFIGRINFNVKKIAVNCGVSIGCVAIASVIAAGIDGILCLVFSNTCTIFQTFN